MIKDGVMMTLAEFRAKVIQECIDALPRDPQTFTGALVHRGRDSFQNVFHFDAFDRARAALEALLPKDRAKELADQFCGSEHDNPHIDQDARMRLFARWLLTNNHISGEGK